MPPTNGLLVKGILLENENLRVHLLSEQGDRIASIFDKRSGLECQGIHPQLVDFVTFNRVQNIFTLVQDSIFMNLNA
jgi:hypothetical protein